MSAASDKNIDRQKLNSIHIGSHRYAPLLRPGSSFSRRSTSTSRHLSGIFHGLPQTAHSAGYGVAGVSSGPH
ncbi:hypothetical protein ACCO45_005407 [Purpureocillium lilacinum]|uniref:Uncharacterized protein n=1 Tax=Purpureocillium lilacinum TaxID=33203 RepID=A0ACC4DY66_PURLI